MVDVKLKYKFPRCVTLDEVREKEELADMMLLKRPRISVQKVTEQEWGVISTLVSVGEKKDEGKEHV